MEGFEIMYLGKWRKGSPGIPTNRHDKKTSQKEKKILHAERENQKEVEIWAPIRLKPEPEPRETKQEGKTWRGDSGSWVRRRGRNPGFKKGTCKGNSGGEGEKGMELHSKPRGGKLRLGSSGRKKTDDRTKVEYQRSREKKKNPVPQKGRSPKAKRSGGKLLLGPKTLYKIRTRAKKTGPPHPKSSLTKKDFANITERGR